jgi:hypothetical protein
MDVRRACACGVMPGSYENPCFDWMLPEPAAPPPMQEVLGGAVGGKGQGVMGSITLDSVMQILPHLDLSASSIVLDAGSGTGR